MIAYIFDTAAIPSPIFSTEGVSWLRLRAGNISPHPMMRTELVL